ncbi:putative virion structural protein [Salmonella phage SPFM20]|nr:putative virion structural protein [Salmonella phage SPFM20]
MARKAVWPHSTPLDIVKLVDDVDPNVYKTTEWLDLFFQALIAAEEYHTIPDYALIGTNNADIARMSKLNAVVIAGPENDSRKTTLHDSGAISTPTTDVTDLPSIYKSWVKAISRFGEWTVQTITEKNGIPNEEDVAALYSPILPYDFVFPEIFTTTKFTIVPGWSIRQALRDYILANSSFTVALGVKPIPMSAIIYGRAGRNPSRIKTSLITNIYTWHDQEDFDSTLGFNLPDHHNKINELADGYPYPILPVDTFLAVKSVVEKAMEWFADEDFNQDYTGFEIEVQMLETTADKVEDPSDVNNQIILQSGAMIQTNSNWFPRWVSWKDEVEFQRLLLGQFNSVISGVHVLTVSQWIYQQSILGNLRNVAFTSKRDELPIKTPAVFSDSYSFAKSKQYFTKENLQVELAALIDNGPGNTAPVGELSELYHAHLGEFLIMYDLQGFIQIARFKCFPQHL